MLTVAKNRLGSTVQVCGFIDIIKTGPIDNKWNGESWTLGDTYRMKCNTDLYITKGLRTQPKGYPNCMFIVRHFTKEGQT
jgi:hypothetical protein